MVREVTIPAKVAHEIIANIDENTSHRYVRARVGYIDPDTDEINITLGLHEYIIHSADYDELTGPPTDWAPDKPAGTYRNDDLWHFIDKQRNNNA